MSYQSDLVKALYPSYDQLDPQIQAMRPLMFFVEIVREDEEAGD